MAITKGLFGYDPYEIQMQQQQRLMQPITQATNPYERIGAGLGTLLGASLFDIQDPRLARAAKLGTITKQIMGENADPTATDFVPKLEKLAETLLAEGEVDAAAYAMEQAKKFTPKREIKTVGNQVVDFSGAEPEVLFTGTDKESIVKTPANFAAAANELGFGVLPNLSNYTREQTAAVNNLLQTRGERTQAAGVPQSGEVKIQDIKGAQEIVATYTKAPQDRLTTVQQLRVSLNEAKRGVGTALPQVRRNLVKLVGDNQIGQAEAQQALGSIGIVGDVISGINQLFTGVPSEEKLKDVEKFITALENEHAKSYNRGRETANKVLSEAKLSPETVKTLIPPEYKTGKDQKKTSSFVEGKVYRDASGNRARYVNGKWEPVQ
jgi:hypothetical protein